MNDAKKEESTAADGIREPGELQMAPSVNHNQHDSGTGDELVSSVTLYRRRPRLLHVTVLPFLAVLYPGWMYVWLGVYGASEYPEAGLLALAAIGIAHVLTTLSGYWSVHAHCWLTCSKVNIRDINSNSLLMPFEIPCFPSCIVQSSKVKMNLDPRIRTKQNLGLRNYNWACVWWNPSTDKCSAKIQFEVV